MLHNFITPEQNLPTLEKGGDRQYERQHLEEYENKGSETHEQFAKREKKSA